MNWWMLAGGLMALICALGHAIIGWSMFYRPISSVITSDLHAGVFTGHRHVAPDHDQPHALGACSARACAYRPADAAAWLIAAQFGGYAVAYLIISLHLGGALKLFQWLPFAATAILVTESTLTGR